MWKLGLFWFVVNRKDEKIKCINVLFLVACIGKIFNIEILYMCFYENNIIKQNILWKERYL